MINGFRVLSYGGVTKDVQVKFVANFAIKCAKFAHSTRLLGLRTGKTGRQQAANRAGFAPFGWMWRTHCRRQIAAAGVLLAASSWPLGCSLWQGQSEELDASPASTAEIVVPDIQPQSTPLPDPFLLAPSGLGGIAQQPLADDQPAPVDFNSIKNIEQRKARFIAYVRPLVEAENDRLDQQHQVLERLYEQFWQQGVLSQAELTWLEDLAREYRLEDLAIPSEKAFRQLLRRVDSLPVELALAQAAYESGWGRSRFAREGFNFFGEWCFEAGCGLVPRRRPSGAEHEVAVFDSPRSSVRSYMHNLNSHPAYQKLRLLRARMRLQGVRPDGFTLATGLRDYSQLGQEYIDRLRSIMRHNQLASADRERDLAL